MEQVLMKYCGGDASWCTLTEKHQILDTKQYQREQMIDSDKSEVIEVKGACMITFFIKDLYLTVELLVLDGVFEYTIYDEINDSAFKIGSFHREGRVDFYKNLCDYIWEMQYE